MSTIIEAAAWGSAQAEDEFISEAAMLTPVQAAALQRLKLFWAAYDLIGQPETCTLTEIRKAYGMLTEAEPHERNFIRAMQALGHLVPTDQYRHSGETGRPARLYRVV
ncbi:MAG: NrtR DNA-binding winged helix domain-containing protein [Candidatus Nanopelagicales bacterium]